jgi:hypothetical protein
VPSDAIRKSVQAVIDSLRCPGAEGINVVLPSTAANGHTVRVRVAPNGPLNAFAWGSDLLGAGLQVDAGGYSPGPPATIRLTGLAPQSLKNAITNFIGNAGPQPLLQVISTGSVAINVPIGTSKTVSSSDTNGKTTLTLDSVPPVWVPPSSGDTIYPYGPVVPAIAASILALCNSLGPSRQSGYGDPFNSWLDTLSLNEIVRVAEDAVDANGIPLVTQVLDGGATIDGLAISIQASDGTNSTPELLYLSQIAVTP